MTLPRELAVKNGRLVQNPVRELGKYHGHRVAYNDVLVTDEVNMQGISGRIPDMTVTVRPAGNTYHAFRMNVAKDGEHLTFIRYKPEVNTIRVDRSRCGIRYDVVHVREFLVRPGDGEIKLRLVMDRHSLELFVNDGEQAASFIVYTPESSDSVSFQAEGGSVLVDVEKFELDFQLKHLIENQHQTEIEFYNTMAVRHSASWLAVHKKEEKTAITRCGSYKLPSQFRDGSLCERMKYDARPVLLVQKWTRDFLLAIRY